MWMLKRTLVLIFSILVLCQTASADWKIHIYEGFTESVSGETELLNSLLDQGDTLAIKAAKELLITSPNELSSLWARLNL